MSLAECVAFTPLTWLLKNLVVGYAQLEYVLFGGVVFKVTIKGVGKDVE